MRKMIGGSGRRRWAALLCAAVGVTALAAFVPGEWRRGAAGGLRAATDASVGRALKDAGLLITEVEIEGQRRTRPSDVSRALQGALGTPSLLVDVDAVRAALEKIEWVAAAEVRVRLPGRLEVRMRERVPAAVWESRGGARVVDTAGKVIKGAPAAGFADLLRVDGTAVRGAVPGLTLMLARVPDLAPRIRSASWVSERRWTLHTDNGIAIHLPEADADAALMRLSSLAGDLDLLTRDVDTIDLRLDDRMAVGLRDGKGLAADTDPGT